MLTELRIDDLGVIDRSVAEFAAGLTVLTGETGAGKTMVVTGLRLLTGGRADPGRVRSGAEKAVVEGRFEVDVPGPEEVLAEVDGEADDDGSVIVVRRVGADGRSRARLGGRSVPASALARFAEPVLAIHGQNDQLRLLSADRQREAVDAHGGTETADALSAYRTLFSRWRAARRSLTDRTERARELAQEADLLRLGLAEIDEVDPRPGEEDELEARIRRLTDSEALREIAEYGRVALSEGDGESGGAAQTADQVATRLETSGDPRFAELAAELRDAVRVLGEVGTELGLAVAELPDDVTAELDLAIGRRQSLKALLRKYGADLTEVVAWAERARTRLDEVDTSDDAVDRLRAEVASLREQVDVAGARLTTARTAAAADLSERVSAELGELSMGGARLRAQVQPAGGGEVGEPGDSGCDEVALLLDGPAGLVPLAKGASGGELSRVMLALEVVLAARSTGGTLVFDEVDAGVGGRAALAIGRRLRDLAAHHQVIVVTHLAQVAAFADTHLVVEKDVSGSRAVSGVHALGAQDRVSELARMLAGMEDTETGLAHARELLDRARGDSQPQVDS